MKLFTRLLGLIVVLALAGPFFMKGPDGRPLWTIQDTISKVKTTTSRWFSKAGVSKAKVALSNEVVVYRWRDADGVWQFSAEVPEGVTAETMRIDTGSNAIQFVQPVLADDEIEEDDEGNDLSEQIESPMIGPYPSPEATRQLIDDVKAIQQQSEDRLKEMDNIR